LLILVPKAALLFTANHSLSEPFVSGQLEQQVFDRKPPYEDAQRTPEIPKLCRRYRYAAEAVRVALLGSDRTTAPFTHATFGVFVSRVGDLSRGTHPADIVG